MRVLLVTTWGTACGIAEHAAYLKAGVEAADPMIQIRPTGEAGLDPACVDLTDCDVVHLNYHAALHSRWTPSVIQQVRSAFRIPVLVTYHDSGVPSTDQQKGIHAASNAMVVHEPMADLPGVIYLRQGVPAPRGAMAFTTHPHYDACHFLEWHGQPILGSVGFPFPWKQFDLLADATAAAGWALLLLAPGATPAQVEDWRRVNPATSVITEFLPASHVVSYLSGCDATAFLYTCANGGTSGAIRQGIAARNAVLASDACRQFRDLRDDQVGQGAITWVDPRLQPVVQALRSLTLQRVDPGMVALAAQDSWTRIGRVYADLYREVVAAGARATVAWEAPEGGDGQISAHLWWPGSKQTASLGQVPQ